MILMHYAGSPVVFDRARTYQQPRPSTFGKPSGLWVSVAGEDDWPTWCRENEFRWAKLQYSYRVHLVSDPNVLTLTTPEGIDKLHAIYATETDFEARSRDVFGRDSRPIDWGAVARDYNGIIIAPYQWSKRLSPDWYYGWDCASGCIWSTEAILAVEEQR